MMKKNLHRTALLLSIGLPYGMHAGEIPDKPNILIFIADDLGWEEVGAKEVPPTTIIKTITHGCNYHT